MEDKCFSCKKNEVGEAEEISFSFGGCDFKFPKPGTKCLECARQEVIKRFESYGQDLIHLENGEIFVDWQYFVGLLTASPNDRKNQCFCVLLNIGILSYNPRGNWGIETSFSSLNLFFGGTCWFTRKDDVLTFARLAYGQVSFDWSIKQFDSAGKVKEVITKEEVLKSQNLNP